MRIYGTAREREAEKKLSVAMVESTRRSWYFEWDRSETIFGNFSENVVQGSMGQGETRQEEVKVEAQPPTQKIKSS
jgi:hypothetical protein